MKAKQSPTTKSKHSKRKALKANRSTKATRRKQPPSQSRNRHTNEDRALLISTYQIKKADHDKSNPPDTKFVISKFVDEFNQLHFPSNPFLTHAASNTIKLAEIEQALETLRLNPKTKTNHHKPTIYKLVAESMQYSINKRESLDIDLTADSFTTRAVLINDTLALHPDHKPDYKPKHIDFDFGRYFLYDKKHHHLLIQTKPTLTRANEITLALSTDQQNHPTLCQSLIVSCDPIYQGGYSLSTIEPIKNGTIIDEYRGTTHTNMPLLHKIDSEYLVANHTTIIDASHPYSCFSRYINENLDSKSDNSMFDNTTDPNKIYIKATRDIEAFEEITLAYGPRYWYHKFRTNTLPPEIHNKVASTYGGHYRRHHLRTPPNYTPPTFQHVTPNNRPKYILDYQVTNAKPYHSMDDSETEHESDTSLDNDSTSSYGDNNYF